MVKRDEIAPLSVVVQAYQHDKQSKDQSRVGLNEITDPLVTGDHKNEQMVLVADEQDEQLYRVRVTEVVEYHGRF